MSVYTDLALDRSHEVYEAAKDHPTRVLGWGAPEEALAAKLPFPLLHTLRNFLMDFPQWADKIEANGGAGLCIDIAADLVSYVAEHHPESSVVHGDAEGGLTPEVWVCRTSESHVELPDIYPVVPAQRDGFAGCHTVACFPVLPGRKTFIYVDLTARQYGSNLPCPIIWEGLPPTYLR